jgi:outer membrane lipoprotein-sorting protein
MSIFDRRPGLRWAVPAGAAVLLVGGAALAPMAAIADSGLEPRTAEELLVALAEPSAAAVSGTVATRADLGLPGLPMGMGPTSGPMALASGESTLRVWTDGPDRQRLALIERASETTVVRNGQEAWVWSSADATADRYLLPERDATGAPDASELPPGVELPSTPQEAAAMALEAIDPTTEVTTSGVGTVAGRDVHELVLTPRDPQTLVARVTLSMDAETNVPLRVRVYSTSIPDPAIEVGFTSVDYGTPDPSLFEFTPPPGATVTEHDVAADTADADGAKSDMPAGPEPTVVGEGWSTIMITELPVDSLADLAEDGMRASSDEPYSRGGDPAATALALIEALPAETGEWGTGRVLRGTLFSAILTDDGRVALGAVSPQALGAALAAQ